MTRVSLCALLGVTNLDRPLCALVDQWQLTQEEAALVKRLRKAAA